MTTSNYENIVGSTLALVGDYDFSRELAQVRARATLETLGADVDHVEWNFQRTRLERNGTACIFEIESAVRTDPTILRQADRLPEAALTIAQLWEALGGISIHDRTVPLMAAAIAYEIAGYQANAATIARQLERMSNDWPLAPLVIDFLQRKLISVVKRLDDIENSGVYPTDLSSLANAAADRLLGRGLAAVCRYLLGGKRSSMSDAIELVERARDIYERVGRPAQANFCFAAGAFIPLIEGRSAWTLIGTAARSGRWERYLKLLGRGTAGRPIDSKSLAELWPSQQSALDAGLVSSRDNMVLRLPTSAGKTRIAEIAIAHQLSVDPSSRCLYVAPYRSLVTEIEDSFLNLFSDLGITITSFVGAYDDDWFEQQIAQDSNLIIATPERIDLLERSLPEFFESVRLIVLDEGQLIGDITRGARYELLMSRLRVRLPDVRFLVMSAVIPDQTLKDFASWLQTGQDDIVDSTWRPSVQRISRFQWQGTKGVIQYEPTNDLDFRNSFVHGIIQQREFAYVNPDTGRTNRRKFPATDHKSQSAAELALHFSGVGPTLVFCPQTDLVDSTATALARRLELASLVGDEIPTHLAEKDVPSARIAAEWFGADHKLVRLLRRGIGIHYGRLPDAVRSAIEQDFRERQISILIATNTLAQGVNLPVRTVIMHSTRRRENNRPVRIPARDYWNIAGRAGRAGFETEGLIVHIVFTRLDRQDFRYYQDRRFVTEPIHSPLLNVLEDLRRQRIAPDVAGQLLNAEILALMVEESPDLLDQTIQEVLNRSLVAAQAPRFGVSISPIVSIMQTESHRIRSEIPDWGLLQTYRATGLSSDSCQSIMDVIQGNNEIAGFLESEQSSVPEAIIQFLIEVAASVPEFATSVDSPLDYKSATQLWLTGMTVSDIELTLTDQISSDSQFGRFASQFFIQTLPWVASVVLLLGKRAAGLIDAQLPATARSLPSMIRFGVPMPESAWCMSAGIPSRRAAIAMAIDYRKEGGEPNYIAFREWLASIENSDLQTQYSMRGSILASAMRAISRFNSFVVPRLEGGIEAELPIEAEVAGTQHEDRWMVARRIMPGDTLRLQREVDNAYDRNAVLVLREDAELGYLPKSTALQLAPDLDAGLQVEAKVVSVQEQRVLVRIEQIADA